MGALSLLFSSAVRGAHSVGGEGRGGEREGSCGGSIVEWRRGRESAFADLESKRRSLCFHSPRFSPIAARSQLYHTGFCSLSTKMMPDLEPPILGTKRRILTHLLSNSKLRPHSRHSWSFLDRPADIGDCTRNGWVG
ncbi:hypothetical protein MPTK1_7g05160 [Marchantia polymorpha subsp. ruderalis]|uniref:Secreted protein n=2 Tax=Marchantia polymorpha TaxID=3197 RepID=A0AAF6BWB6_MARPO|nr:hypothetical protein MARPO_0062s0009 [Marchantia polymorpha]BBN16300.1 hypothetical protein Mp_7g05160 [Marchantia polymorpha subsp. ruderalis]|eukprot:PTQ36581.1 hypothetical protein MARPO_0062s0009 [Marchantia polymorpha]